MNSRYRQVCLLTGIILVLILSACGSSSNGSSSNGNAKTRRTIIVGGLSKQIYLPNELAKRLGYFDQAGLDVSLVDETSGQASTDAVLAGQVEAGSGSYNHTIELQALGKSLTEGVQLNIPPGEAEMVSAKEAGEDQASKELKGKNLGLTQLRPRTKNL